MSLERNRQCTFILQEQLIYELYMFKLVCIINEFCFFLLFFQGEFHIFHRFRLVPCRKMKELRRCQTIPGEMLMSSLAQVYHLLSSLQVRLFIEVTGWECVLDWWWFCFPFSWDNFPIRLDFSRFHRWIEAHHWDGSCALEPDHVFHQLLLCFSWICER